jgi:hypothetical protein
MPWPVRAQTAAGATGADLRAQQLAAERSALQEMLKDPNTPAEKLALIQALLEWNARGVTIAEYKQRQTATPPAANNLAEAEAAPLPANIASGGGSILQNLAKGRDAEASSRAAASLGLVKSQQTLESATREGEAKLREAQAMRNQAGATALAQRQQDAASAASQQAATGLGAVMGESLVQSVQQGAQAAGQALGGGAVGRISAGGPAVAGGSTVGGGGEVGGGAGAGASAAAGQIFGGAPVPAAAGVGGAPEPVLGSGPAVGGEGGVAAQSEAMMDVTRNRERRVYTEAGKGISAEYTPLKKMTPHIRVSEAEYQQSAKLMERRVAAPAGKEAGWMTCRGCKQPFKCNLCAAGSNAKHDHLCGKCQRGAVQPQSGRGQVTCGRCKASYRCDLCANPNPNIMAKHMHLCANCLRDDQMYMNCPKHGRVGRSREGCPRCYQEEINDAIRRIPPKGPVMIR